MQGLGVIGELVLEGELLAGVLAGVVELCSPHGQRAQRLGLRVVFPPHVLERLKLHGVAAVQCDNGASHLLAPLAVAAVRDHGLQAARHLDGEIWEVRVDGYRVIYRILFAQEGSRGQILLALEGLNKKSRKTPPATIALAK